MAANYRILTEVIDATTEADGLAVSINNSLATFADGTWTLEQKVADLLSMKT